MIEFDSVTKVYGDGTEAVTDVSFSVPCSETITLVGPSGCGKTTTMKMVNGLIDMTSGEIRIDGEPIQVLDPVELRRGIGYIIQDVGLFNHMTIGENIGIVPDVIGWDDDAIDERVDELLELVRLDPEMRSNYPHELSGGQQQRVGVARALAAEPDVMLMDEPFGALDPITREELQDEFLRIQKGLDVTIIFVTHDIREALKMGDRVAVLRDGQLVQLDTPADLLREPANKFVESFLGDDRRMKQLELVTVGEVMGPRVNRSELSVSVDDSLRAGVQTWIMANSETVSVVDDDGSVVGSLSKKHIRQALGSNPGVIEEVHD